MVTVNLDVNSQVSVYNIHGIEVISVKEISAHGKLNMSELAPGIYTIKIDTGLEIMTRMVIKY
ncbi:MAG: T9SS type A sorting domain-containing protein [Cytophagaceae bacterium]|nr:T9SS type A sorting domain-containing protein [Cytophagaceae bacterium]